MYIKSITVTYTPGSTPDPDPATPSATVAFSPVAGEVTSGSTVTLSLNGTADGFVYTTDDTEPSASNGTKVSGNSTTVTVNAAMTIKAKAYNYSNNTYALGSQTSASYTISGGGGGGDVYELVTSASQLVAGKEYLIASATGSALFAGVSSNLGQVETTGFTYDETAQTITLNSGCTAVPLTLGGTTGAWTFHYSDGYIAYTNTTTSKNNNLYLVSSASDNGATWTINTSNLPSSNALIVNVYNTSRKLQFNSDRFCGYTGSQSAIALYKKVEAAKAYDVTVTQATGGTITASPEGEKVVDAGDKITVTATPDTGYEFGSWSFTGVSESDPDANNQITATGNVTITASFTQVKYNILRTITTNGESSTAGGWLGSWTGWADEPNATDATGYTVNAYYNSTVTFKAGTNSGYQVGTVTAVDGSSNAVALTVVSSDDTGTVYSFTMPASAVTITANFVTYHPTVKLGGLVNGSTWIDAAANGVALTYDSTNNKYTGRVFFTGNRDESGTCDYFFVFEDNTAKYPSATGNYWITSVGGTAMTISLTGGSSSNFRIVPGIYDIELNGDRTSLKVTQVTPTLTFTPASGASVETGSMASVSSDLPSLIAAIDADATVTVGVAEAADASTWNASYEFVTADATAGSKTVYGKAYIGNIAVTGSATYTVTKASTSNQYQLATTLTADKKYIIVSEGYNAGFTTGGNAESITINDHVTTLANGSGVIVFTLGGSSGAYTFATSDGKYLQWTSSTTVNAAGTDATDTKAQWDVSLSDGTIVNVSSGRYLQYNDGATGNKFRAYAEANQTAVQLYEQVEVGDYTITYATVTGGTLSGRADANAGDVITVTANPSTGYACTSISVSPSAAVTDNHDGTYTFTMPAANVTVTPTWAEAIAITYVNKYLDNNGENPTEANDGGTVTGPSSAVEGAPVNVTVTPDDAYQLQSLTYAWNNGSGSADITEGKTFLMPATPTTVTAVFEKKPFSITVVSANGQVTGVPATAVSGQTVSFTITPVAGYTITNVFLEYANNDETVQTVLTATEGVYSFSMLAKDVTVRVGYFAGDEYELVKDVSDIVEGETYLIVGGSPTGVMGNVLSSGYINSVALTETTYNSSTGIISSASTMALVDFVAGSGDYAGKWAVHTASGYLNNTSTTGNGIVRQSTPAYASITIDPDTHVATIQLVDNTTRGLFSYNTGSPRFTFYGGSQGSQYIYKLANSNKVKKPTITGAAGQHIGLYNFIGTDQVTLACATDGATIKYKIGDVTEWTTYSGEPFVLPQTALGGTVTVKACATKDGMDASEEVSAVFTCVKPEWHTKPCGDNWNCTDQEYDNPVFIYPIASLDCRNAYGRANTRFFYTLNGDAPTTESAELATPSSGEKFLFLDEDVILRIIPVINGIAGDEQQGIITFKPAAPTATLAADSYDGDQQTRLSTTTKSSLNGTSWTTKIYYAIESATLGTPAAFAFDASNGEATSTGWKLYDPTTAPYIDIKVENGDVQTLHAVTLTNFYGGEFTGQYSGASVNLNTTGTWVKSDETEVEYTLTAANLDVVFSPAGGTYLYAKDVTLKAQNAIGTATILYSLTWANPDADHTNVSAETYTQPIHIDQDATLYVYAEDERTGDGATYEKTHVYKIGVQEPLFSPYPGDYYDEDTDKYLYGDYYVLPSSGTSTLDVEIFDVSPNARIYYTYTKTTTDDNEYDGSKPYPEPAAPTNTTGTLYSGPITIEQGYTYVFSAIAYVGDLASPVRTRAFTVRTNTDSGDYWYSVKEMNEDDSGVTKTFANPVQVIWMSTHSYDQVTPEYCFISDNSGYGMVFFRSSNDAPAAYQSYTKFKQGDWLPGKSITGKTAVWSDSYINELGGGSGTGANVTAWPSAAMNSRPITPETTTCKAIRDGWTYGNGTPTSYSGNDYKSYVDAEKNLFGHYVHLRKNTITQVEGKGGGNGKHTGIITGELGTPLQYYDGFYLFSGYSYVDSETNKTVTTEDYDQDFFNSVQNLGGTFDVYAVVQFYGTNTTKSKYSYAPFEVFPIAFDWIFPPIFHLEGDASASDMTNDNPERTIHAPSTVTLTCDTRGAIMWYKTSDMEDYEVYEGQEIPVTKSMEISTYSIHSTEHFDQLESKVRTLTINMGDIEQPVISPESCVKAIGDEAVTVSITCETSEATIWYTTDGSDPDDETNTGRSEYTGPFTVSETTTVRAVASAMDGSETFYGMEAESKTYTFVKSNGIVYDLVKSASQLDPGYVYVIVNKQYNAAVMNVQDTNNRKSAGVKFLESTDAGYTGEKEQVFGNDDLAVFTLNNENGNWVFHTANGVNNASIGYMYGAVSGSTNQWKSEFTKDSEGKTLTTITIDGANSDVDKAYAAHILYTGGSGDRYLRFNKSYDLFNTYSSEMTGQEVFLYRKLAWPLAKIEKVGVKGSQYTIADELIGVYANGTKLWAKDQGNVSISKRENTEGWEDYVAALYSTAQNAAEWDQSNWVCLELGDADAAAALVGKFITPTSVTGEFSDNVNYTLTVSSAPTSNGDAGFQATDKVSTTSVNVMTAPNFNDAYTGENGAQTTAAAGRTFFFVRPKVQEVVTVTNVTWDGSKFVIPAKNGPHNTADFSGAIGVNWDLYEGTNKSTIESQMESLVSSQPDMEFTFLAVVSAPAGGSGAPRRAPKAGDATTTLVLQPTSITLPATPTGVDDVKVANREVKAVKYVDVVGRVSDRPFEGLNIIVTEYTDGSVETVKVLK